MPKTLDLPLSTFKFPSVCVACLSPATETYELDKTFTYARNVHHTVRIAVPMCQFHAQRASTKSEIERILGWLGFGLGLLVWAVVSSALWLYWASSGQGNLLVNLFLAGFLGLGLFLIVWVATLFWLAPQFADADAKQARNVVQITHYWPQNKTLRLTFENEQLAEMVARENQL